MRSVKPSFTFRRLQNILSATLSISSGIVASGLIISSHAISLTGSASGEDDASGWINDPFPCFTPRPTPCPGPCSQLAVLAQNFDNVAPPILPPDWLATNVLGPPPFWVTSNSGLPMPPADTLPNAAFVDDPSVVSDKRLDSLHFPVSGASVHLLFEHNFNLEASDVDPNVGFDGGVLEMSFDGGNTFQDILAVGGSFIMGGYNRTISTDRGSPIAGRQAWSGNSGGFICTEVSLPPPSKRQVPLANGQRQQRLRRRLARRHNCYHFVRTPSGLSNTDFSASPYAGATSPFVPAAKSSRYARLYSGTSPEPVIARQVRFVWRLGQCRTLSRFTEWCRREPSDMGRAGRETE